ncbi:MAG: selenium-dependent xanthine dehydrogenase [Elusimicrobiota bacterium]|jgi:selenium-dependent xanthine dehydrogenase
MDTIVRWTLNGKPREYRGSPERSLLHHLRDELGVTSAKDGCSPQAACGACTVQVGGKATLACATKMGRLESAEVVTIEGLDPFVQEAFAEAFAQKGGSQCGFCIPGFILRADALLKTNPSPSREEVAKALQHNLCRCTGYVKIIDSILLAAEALRTRKPVPVPKQTGKWGSRLPKYDIKDVVLGRRPFVADLKVPGMLHAAFRFSDHPRAVVRRIDASKALKLAGVERVLTAKDVPGDRVVGLIVKDWPVLIAEGETTHYVGDVLAVAVAATRELAREAAALIQVDYEVLEPVLDPLKALEPGAPKVHPAGNELEVSVAKKGDVEKAFKECAHIVEQVYTTQLVEHAFLETEACLAEPDADGLRVYSQTQGVYEDRKQIAKLLGLPEAKVRVVLVPNGGGFGGKEDLSVQGQTALAAWLLKKPVRTAITRDESIRLHPKRHPLRMEYKLGCDAQGRLLALRARIVGDSGAYASVGGKVLERACGHAAGAYDVPNVDIRAVAVYTNNLPCGAMRGFGANQATFAMESAFDELCEKGGFDRWKVRWENALTEGRATATGQILDRSVGVRATLSAVQEEFYKDPKAGLACGIKNCGIGNGMNDVGNAKIFVRSPERIELYHGWTEMGQGVHTVAVQTFCEETGLPPELVSVRTDTADDVPCGMTTSSRATSLVGHALIDACKAFKKDLKEKGLAKMAGLTYPGTWVCDWSTKPGADTGGKPVCTHYSYSYASQVVHLDEKGEVREIVAAHDAGKIVNRTLFEGQIEGSLHMGLGYALCEELELEGGRPKSTRLRDLGILRAHQTPKLTVIGVEVPDVHGPHGAKGVGEIGLVPTAGAVANALARFDGVRRRSLPLKRKK